LSGVVYLYGFVPAEAIAPGDELVGIDDSEVRLLEVRGLTAVVSDLDGADYAETRIEASLKDLDWLAPRGERHERVVTWFADHTTIVPARFLTVFSSDEAVRAEVDRRRDEIVERLQRFRDVREWDLKVAYDLESLSRHLGQLSEATSLLDQEIAAAAPGRRYLLERRRAEVVRSEVGGVARRLARGLLDDLRPHAEKVAELQLPAVRDNFRVVLNAALLVKREAAATFQTSAAEVIREVEEKGLRVALTGPWAPYRFMGDELV
jgi:hypothetical protein